MNAYIIPIADEDARQQARFWLFLGLFSLILSGLFAVLIVLARTPYLQDIIPFADFFHSALVVHVDLSVLVWFLAFGGVLWSLNSTSRFLALGWAALGCAAPFEADADLCACVCAADCGGACGADQVCNTSVCACQCAPDCGAVGSTRGSRSSRRSSSSSSRACCRSSSR